MKKIVVFGRGKVAQVKECKPQDYKSLFMRETSLTARSGKTAYISKEHHERITKMLHVIGKNEVSLFDFLHNVLEQHFATYQENISELYDRNLERKVFYH
jgi:dTDP-4-dehydrorhamnose reductase